MKFGRLEVLERLGGRFTEYLCRCDCGNEVIVRGGNLTSGNTQSCGCLIAEVRHSPRAGDHRYSRTRLYNVWQSMKARCNNPSTIGYKWYGEKGIEVCEEWSRDFKTFRKWALENGYKDNLTIDRIDGNGNYTPENCRWATIKEQQNNRKSNRKVAYKGEIKTASQWAEHYGISLSVLVWRLDNWDNLDDVFEKPVDKYLRLKTYKKEIDT